jgi:hypothetical protein
VKPRRRPRPLHRRPLVIERDLLDDAMHAMQPGLVVAVTPRRRGPSLEVRRRFGSPAGGRRQEPERVRTYCARCGDRAAVRPRLPAVYRCLRCQVLDERRG